MTQAPPSPFGEIRPVRIEDEMRASFVDYAMSVNVSRAIPDIRDGLKPVQRRILYAMSEMNLAAATVQEVRHRRRRSDGQVPPPRRHADLRRPGAHGPGLVAALPADRRPGQLRQRRQRPAGSDALHGGAPRRRSPPNCWPTSTRTPSTSSPTSTTEEEPIVLPSRIPNLLINGASGIGVSLATNIPPHNLGEVLDAVIGAAGQPGHLQRRDSRTSSRARTSPPAASSSAARRSSRLTRRPRPHRRARAGPHRGVAHRPGPDHRHRAALPGEQGRAGRPHRRAGQGSARSRASATCATSPTARACASSSSWAAAARRALVLNACTSTRPCRRPSP